MQQEAVAGFRPSPQQEQLWLREPEGPTGRNQLRLVIDGPLDDERLRDAISTVVDRHEILRTTFQRQTGIRVPLQVVRDQLAPAWHVVDVSSAGDGRDARVDELAESERSIAVDFDNGPLLRTALATLSPDRHLLLVTVPSICADLGALSTIAGEIVAAYSGSALADEPLQYADFAEWQHELLQSVDADSEQARAYWETQALRREQTSVPFLRTSAPSTASRCVDLPLAPKTIEALGRITEDYGVGDDLVALAAWYVLLGRLSGSDEVDVSVVLPERPHAELNDSVGPFAKAVPVHVSLGGEPTFAEVVDRLARAAAEATGWQDYLPLDETQTTSIGFRASAPATIVAADGLTFSIARFESARDGQALVLSWTYAAGVPSAAIVYGADAFDENLAARLARQLGRVLDTVAADPKTPIDEIDVLDRDDRRELLFDFNDTARTPPSSVTIDELVRAAAAVRPDGIAVVDDGGTLTYAELDARVNQLANRLRGVGVVAGTVVGLCTDRSIDMVVGLLGILRAGAAYLPLHFEHPPKRLAHQLAETSAPAVVTQSALVDRLPSFDGDVVRLDGGELHGEPTSAPDPCATPDDLVYVIYTSGSTGTPKGVGVTNANLVNYVSHMLALFEAEKKALTYGLVTAISTDLGNTSVFSALCSGGTLALISPGVAADPGALTSRLRELPLDVLKITPSHLGALLVGTEAAVLLPREWLVVGGEACSWDLVGSVRELSDCRILNHYGPTETTVGSCTMLVEDGPGPYAPRSVPIGRPIANSACYVLDHRSRPVPIGVGGSLFIAGAGVASGYVAQEELTTERFLADPFGVAPGGRMYATGDLARWLPDGTLEFLGREDEQVKIRGYRVEPSEIESALRRLDGIREAVVVAGDDPSGGKRLHAYVVADGPLEPTRLRSHLVDWVPEFMVPSAFVLLEELPRTPSGKVDKLALPEPETAGHTEFVAPRTPMEEKVAAIWADVLGIDRVSITDDFFALGGHSLLATQIVAQIRSDLSVDLPLHSLFTSPTVESLSQSILELLGTDADTADILQLLEELSDEEAAALLDESPGGGPD